MQSQILWFQIDTFAIFQQHTKAHLNGIKRKYSSHYERLRAEKECVQKINKGIIYTQINVNLNYAYECTYHAH